MIVYAAQYSDCVYESDFATISLHFSEDGAYKATEKDKLVRFTLNDDEQREILEMGGRLSAFKQQSYQQYRVVQFEVQE